MSIAKRFNQSMKHFQEGDFDNAVIHSFIALDGTAKKIFNIRDNKKRFTNFIDANIDVIESVMFLVDKIPREAFLDGNTFSELVYKMRCSILHEGFLDRVTWDPKKLTYVNDAFYIPNSLIVALNLASILQAENKDEPLEWGIFFEFYYKKNGVRIRPIEYAGKKREFLEMFKYLREA